MTTNTTDTTSMTAALQARDEGMENVTLCAERNDPGFTDRACEFILQYLAVSGPSSGEQITNACKDAGIVPHDDRAFGPVYCLLSRAKSIVKTGTCKRARGHATSGGNIWDLNRDRSSRNDIP